MVQCASFEINDYISNKSLDGDVLLFGIIQDTEILLARLERAMITRFFGYARNRYDLHLKSWSRVRKEIDSFVATPEQRYSYFILVLNTEMKRFAPGCPYVKQLQNLKALVAAAPRFQGKLQCLHFDEKVCTFRAR